MTAKKSEAALASIGLVMLGLLAYYLLSRQGDTEPPPAPQAQSAAQRAREATPGSATQGRDLARLAAIEVRGSVRDLLTGAAVGEVSVQLRGEHGMNTTVVSDAGGQFTTSLAPGRYRVRALGTDVAAFDDAWIVITAGVPHHSVDVEVLRLARVEGRVVDGNGDPVAGAAIGHRTWVLERALDERDTAPAGTASSGADGGFRVRVPPGEVTLMARAAGKPESNVILRWVAPGARLSGVEIVMDAGAAISGVVVDPGGKPVASARVVARGEEQHTPSEAHTGADGAFRLQALVPGQVHVHAEAPGFARSPLKAVQAEADREVRDVVLALAEPRAIRGRVVDEQGTPVAGARVHAEPMLEGLRAAEAAADTAGAFTLTGLGAGPFSLVASADGFAPARLGGVDAPASDVELVMTTSGWIAGQVTSGGQPLRAFTVALTPRSGPDELEPNEPMRVRMASADGGYRLEGVTPGRYDVTFAAPGLAPQTVPGVDVPAGGEGAASAELGAGGSIAGQVTSARTGAPIRGALVRLSTGSARPATYTDAGGDFVIDDIAAGRRSLEVRHPEYVGTIRSGLDLVAGGRARVDVALEALAFGEHGSIEFAGIGAAMSIEDGAPVLLSVLPGGPADLAGLESGDELTHLDGRSTRDRSLGEIIEDIRGVVGTVIHLTVQRGEVVFERDVVRGKVRFGDRRPAEVAP